MKNGAAERPSLAGAAAGLAAGGIAAALYAWHCTDDSPLFLAVWYTTAIAAVTATGALIGSRYLTW
ncbi:NrsF family protein [Rhizobium mongolense]|uniref:NrsF family protein n=1 Tax=Rhizobium mongolense TaxID=57676 RepID=UPI0034A0F8F0